MLNKEKTVYVAFNLSVAMMIGGDIGPYYKVKGLGKLVAYMYSSLRSKIIF